MTATLYRRLVDLPPGFLARWPNARTTDDVMEQGRDPVDLAEDVRRAAQERDQRVFVAVLSVGQTCALTQHPETTSRRILAKIEADAQRTPIRQRVKNYSDDIVPRGAPGAVAILWDGRIRPDVSQRSRPRRDKRFTLDAEVLQWIELEAERRGESQSAVVQDALRNAMAAHELGTPLDQEEPAEGL